MKTLAVDIIKLSFLVTALLLFRTSDSKAQGRVVVNEFMPWSGCNTTSEFVELMNFGPGPMNIGCYIVTNGQYSITIPPNTIINPGEYYVMSGQNILSQNCGNIDSAVAVDLNWTTCNCTNQPIPTTGDGFMQNGGGSNEKIVLMDPNLNIIDAVSRSSTPGPSVAITTATLSGSCTPRTFNLSSMTITYESVGVTTGIDNSFARKVDGDCGWVKTTDISASAPNKTGSTSSASYTFSTLSASECNGSTGSISISVSATNAASLFPMSYTLAFDADSNNIFNETDHYLYGIDSTASSIDISNLAYGRYRITVGSASGCNLQSFDFFIFNCYGVVLPYRIVSFEYSGNKNEKMIFTTRLKGITNLDSIILEGGDEINFHQVSSIDLSKRVIQDDKFFTIQILQPAGYEFYRLKLVDRNNVFSYSKRLKIDTREDLMLWPNPCKEKMFIRLTSSAKTFGSYKIYNALGQVSLRKSILLQKGINIIPIETGQLLRGQYHLSFINELNFTNSFKFYKE